MTVASRSLRRAVVLLAAISTLAVSNPAHAQVPHPGTGAQAFKNCPADVATIGQTVTCNFIVVNTGDIAATVSALTETSPFAGGTPVEVSCTIAGGTVIDEGDLLAPATPCLGTFQNVIPDDPTLCNAPLVDRVDIALAYGAPFPVPLIAGAFATNTTLILCGADIMIAKVADELGKIGDPVTYTFTICNVGVRREPRHRLRHGARRPDVVLPGDPGRGPVRRGRADAWCRRPTRTRS